MRLTRSAKLTLSANHARVVRSIDYGAVIRALHALATGWDMRGRPPEKLRQDRVHGFLLDAEGGIVAGRINRPLLP